MLPVQPAACFAVYQLIIQVLWLSLGSVLLSLRLNNLFQPQPCTITYGKYGIHIMRSSRTAKQGAQVLCITILHQQSAWVLWNGRVISARDVAWASHLPGFKCYA